MNRRAFLAAAIGTAAFDPERALYVPGRKTYIIPPNVGVMPPCPITVFPIVGCGGHDAKAGVLNAMIRDRWRRDPRMRDTFERALAAYDHVVVRTLAHAALGNAEREVYGVHSPARSMGWSWGRNS